MLDCMIVVTLNFVAFRDSRSVLIYYCLICFDKLCDLFDIIFFASDNENSSYNDNHNHTSNASMEVNKDDSFIRYNAYDESSTHTNIYNSEFDTNANIALQAASTTRGPMPL